MTTISYLPYFRADRGAVVIRIIIERKIAKVISTGIRIEEGQWNEETRKIVGHPNAKLLNEQIQSKINTLQAELSKAQLLGVQLTTTKVKRIAEGNVITTDFYEWATKWVQEKYSNKDTRDWALSEINKLKGFTPALSFGDIDKSFLTKYHNYMKTVLNNKSNTPWKSLKFVRTMLYDAESIGGMVHTNPFRTGEFKMPKYEPTFKDGLYIKECDQIEKLMDKDLPVLVKYVAARFLFMCYCGLRISDAQKFDEKQHIKYGERLVMKTQKEGVWVDIELHNRLAKILDRLREIPRKKLSDQKMNQWLKIVGDMAGIERMKLTNHVGRHTFGCILAEMDIPIDVAQRLLGHKDRKSTEIYYKLRQHKIDEHTRKLNNF